MAAIERALIIGLVTLAVIVSMAGYPCQIKRVMTKVESVMAKAIRGTGGPDVTTERVLCQ